MLLKEILEEKHQSFHSEEEARKALVELSEMQRDNPERIMVKIQHVSGGGILNPVVEHVGDIMHRMNEFFRFNNLDFEKAADSGRDYVITKSEKGLNALKSSYGFKREMTENLESNAKHDNISYRELREKVDTLLNGYAQAHGELPTYNLPQDLAQRATVAIGEQRWQDAIYALEQLYSLAKNKENYIQHFTKLIK